MDGRITRMVFRRCHRWHRWHIKTCTIRMALTTRAPKPTISRLMAPRMFLKTRPHPRYWSWCQLMQLLNNGSHWTLPPFCNSACAFIARMEKFTMNGKHSLTFCFGSHERLVTKMETIHFLQFQGLQTPFSTPSPHNLLAQKPVG